MMTQAYPSAGDLDGFDRLTGFHRSMSNHYYDHNVPYNHYPYQHNHRRSHRSEYPGRPSNRTLIHDLELARPNGQAPRKRIGVACTRCRKRKIKCTGDVGDGSGCAACKQQGGEGAQCTFNRVGSKMIPEYEEYLTNNQPPGPADASLNLDATSGGFHEPTPHHTLNHRQSLPILQTRAAYPESYESYSASPIDGHPYSSYSMPRNDSLSSSYDIGFRPWSNAAMMPPAPAANAYDQSPGYTFGSISSPSFPTYQVPQHQHQQQQHPSRQEAARLPSVTSDTFSSLNMGHLYISLPTQTVQNRRLPIPNTSSSCDIPAYPGPDLPEIRPLAEPRTRLNSTHSRIRAPWASDGGYPDSRNASTASLAPPNRMSLQPIQSTSMVQEPAVGYHYNAAEAQMTTAQSPSISPAAAGPSSSSVTFAGGLPYTNAMTPVSYGTYYGLPPITTFQPHDSRNGMNVSQSTSSYGFHSDAATTTTSSSSSDGSHTGAQGTTYASYPTIRHPQPQHAASAEALGRQASFDQQQQHQQHQRSMEGAQRISVERLSGGTSGYSES